MLNKEDLIIFWFSFIIVLETIPTWFVRSYYIFDISVATIIATLVLSLVFISKKKFIKRMMIFIYIIKLSNIVSLIMNYCNSKYMYLMDISKPIMDGIIYLLFIMVFAIKAKEYLKRKHILNELEKLNNSASN